MAAKQFTDHAHVVRKDGGLKMAKHIPLRFVPGTEWIDPKGRLHGVLLLSDASKMPSLSFSLPAGESCPWALYGHGTICGSCYAQQGRYTMPNVARAQQVRFEWVRRCMQTAAGQDEFVTALVDAITDARNSYFRNADSGDLFSPEYVRCWARIVRQLPEVTFWFPTRSWRALTVPNMAADVRAQWALALTELASEPNVTMRPSALFFNAPAPMVRNLVPGMAAGTTARDDEGFTCPATRQGNICGDCRVCYDRPDLAVSYHKHGTTVARKARRPKAA